MEEDGVAALFQSLGLSAGAELSSNDVRLLFCKVFHASSDTGEAHAAMKKIARGDSSWSCSGQNVLDVLLEMEMERERKDMLYWDFQLLNSLNLHHSMESQSKDPDTLGSAPCGAETVNVLPGGLVGTKKLCGKMTNTKRLKKAAGHCWARLASEGVKSTLPFPWQSQRLCIRDQAWGCISLSDVLLLVEVKYDVVMLLLYREMLQKHHSKDSSAESVWKTLSPWQQHQEVKVLGELADEVLESVDTFGLAVLPGALRIYKACSDASLGVCPESVERSWSAASFLNELQTFRQQEQNTLTVLGQRLHGGSLRLLCLYIRLATYRAQREKTSYSALLAARQSWEEWPLVVSPCRTEQVELWFHDREEEEKEEFKTLQQKTELQLLVLSQEQERKHLISLLHQISMEDLKESDSDTGSKQASLKASCMRWLRKICPQIPSNHTNHQNQKQGKWSQLLEDGAMLLMIHLIELQEVQASDLLQTLQDQNVHEAQALRDKYEAEIEAQHFTNLIHLLMSNDPLTSGSEQTENNSNDQIGPESPHSGEIDGLVAAPISSEQKEVHSANTSAKQEVCSGCGAVMEDLPYLEISCAPDTQGNVHEGLAAEEGGQDSETNDHESYEEQRSLITLAWSKPPEEDGDYKEQIADEETKQNQVRLSNMKTQVQSTVQESDMEENQNKDQPDEGGVASDLQTHAVETANLQIFPPHFSESTENLCSETPDHTANATREVTEVEMCPSEPFHLRGPEHLDLISSQESTTECSFSGRKTRESTLMERDQETHPVSAVERERTMRNLVDLQRKFEQKHQRDKERQLLRVQERLSIIQNRKAEEDLLGLKNTDRLRHLTQDLPVKDKKQQKTVVKERLEQLRRERSYIMQSRRDRNMMGFKELLAPVHLHSSETEDGTN